LNGIGTNADFSTIGGGNGNIVGSNTVYTTIAGGTGNTVSNASYSVISGGTHNHIDDGSAFATIAGGDRNEIGSSDGGAIGGGQLNTIANNSIMATIPGGELNVAGANYSLAAGYRAKADHQGSFVWSDSYNFDFHSTVPNGFFARSVGGVKFVTGVDGSGNETAGVRVVAGASAWSTLSDRNAKKNIETVDCGSVLDKLAHVPVSHWNYKWEKDDGAPHIGPMAQDFKAAFYPGRDDKSISTLEFDGVELAAIQGLNQKLNEKAARITALEQELSELRAAVKKLSNKKD